MVRYFFSLPTVDIFTTNIIFTEYITLKRIKIISTQYHFIAQETLNGHTTPSICKVFLVSFSLYTVFRIREPSLETSNFCLNVFGKEVAYQQRSKPDNHIFVFCTFTPPSINTTFERRYPVTTSSMFCAYTLRKNNIRRILE